MERPQVRCPLNLITVFQTTLHDSPPPRFSWFIETEPSVLCVFSFTTRASVESMVLFCSHFSLALRVFCGLSGKSALVESICDPRCEKVVLLSLFFTLASSFGTLNYLLL